MKREAESDSSSCVTRPCSRNCGMEVPVKSPSPVCFACKAEFQRQFTLADRQRRVQIVRKEMV